MSKSEDKIKFAKLICAAAKLYKDKLVGRKFLYIFDNRYIEVLFKKKNYKHLTGVATNLSADNFYQNAVRGILTGKQIWFDAEHPYKLCCRKIKHLRDIANVTDSECFMLEDITTEKVRFKFGATDLNFTLCFDKEYGKDNTESECFIVKSLRDEDCFSRSSEVYEISHIFSCRNDEKVYSELIYMDQKSNLNDLPQDIVHMLDTKLLSDQ